MAFEYELPDVGEGVAEGEIVAWHVEPGDHVEEDQVLAEVETDKAVVDLPSPVTGTIRELHAEEGEIVPVGSVVVTIDVDGEVPDEETVAVEEPEEEATAVDESAETPGETVETAVPGGRVFAPPNVRRLARELGVDISAVEGSGPGGRVAEGDVRAAANANEGEDEPARKSAVKKRGERERKSAVSRRRDTAGQSAEAVSSAEAANRERTLATPATRKVAEEHGVDIDEVPTEKTRDGEPFVEPEDIEAYVEAQRVQPEEPVPAETADGVAASTTTTGEQPVTTEPYRGIRRTIGNQMQQSASTIPHATHHDNAAIEELVATRSELKTRAEEQGIKLTYMPFVLKAIVAALKEHPVLNTELDEESEEIHYKEYYNIGIAVATDAGLMVPVVKEVDQKGLLQLASEVNELAEKARERKIAPEEMQDGTFTITNFGAIGGEYATPIINHPETAILGLGAIEQRPAVEDGEVTAKHTLPLSLSIDHRVIDGAEAAAFTNTVIEYLENPTLLLLES